MRITGFRALFIAATFFLTVTALRFKPWLAGPAVVQKLREELSVGFLPVTCHLTCPVTDYATRSSKSTKFESRLYLDFPTVAESIKAGHLKAAFMIAPLAMKLREQGIPMKILYLGHRDGSTIMVRSDLKATRLRDLRGKTFAVPSKFSNQNLVIRKLMAEEGLTPTDVRFVELPPPDMPGALAAKAIDAYFVGEPHAAKAELNGTGRVLYHAKDIWPKFISCVLVAHESLIKSNPGVVRDLVRGIAESGEWAETHRMDAARIASPYFRQDEKLLRFVLMQPPDRVSYRMLDPGNEELEKIRDMALEAGILNTRINIADLVDRSFIPSTVKSNPDLP